MEEWRDIVGYEGYYKVSSFGRIMRLDTIVNTNIQYVDKRLFKGRVLSINQKSLYKKVGLCKEGVRKNFWVHRLVAFAFPEICGEWFEGAVVNHKDENPENNCAENLEWCTQKHNMSWNGVIKRKVAPKLSKTEEQKKLNRKQYLDAHKEERKEYMRQYYLKRKTTKR